MTQLRSEDCVELRRSRLDETKHFSDRSCEWPTMRTRRKEELGGVFQALRAEPLLPPRWLTFSMRLRHVNAPFRILLHWWAERGAHLLPARLGGLRVRVVPSPPGVVAWIASESRTARGLSTVLPRDTSLRIAQRISCTLHRANARAILRRSPGCVNGSSGLVGDQVHASGW